MIAELLHRLGDVLRQMYELILLFCQLWALWLTVSALYVLIDILIRSALLRGWFGDANDAQHLMLNDPGRLKAIEVDQNGASCPKAPRSELASLLILGVGSAANMLVARRVAECQGGVIAIGAHGLSERIALKHAVRFCPGAHNSVRLNPMLMLQAEPFAWREARILGASLIGGDNYAAEILAAFMLDQLFTAPVEERHLAALRRRLFEPDARALQGRVHLKLGEAVQEHPEIARLARKISTQGEITAQAFSQIAQALRPWADGRIETATRDIDLHLSDVACGRISALFIEAPPGDEILCQGLFAALAGLAMMQLTDAAKPNNVGRAKIKPVFLILDDAALISAIPLLRQRMPNLASCGVRLIVKAADVIDVAVAMGGSPHNNTAALRSFEAVAAIGSQEKRTAQFLSDQAGAARLPHLGPGFAGAGIWKYAIWLLPVLSWPKTPYLKPETLEKLKPLQAVLLQRQSRPKLRMLAFSKPDAQTTWRSKPLPPIAHAWTAPPIPQRRTTLQYVREPVDRGAVDEMRKSQPELPLQPSREILPPELFSPQHKPKLRRKNA